MAHREKFGSRLGFILVSAGCAVGLGNVWKFPYMCGAYGGAVFILVYLLFLAILGLPILVCEFAVGRASQQSVASSFRRLQPAGARYHKFGLVGIAGNYLLMMFYTVVAGWMLYYFFRMLRGDFSGKGPEAVLEGYHGMLQSPLLMTFFMAASVLLAFGVCSAGLRKGVEPITKAVMLCLLLLMAVLAVRTLTLPGAEAGIRFYLVADPKKLREIGAGNVIFAAMSQAFFTLSTGMGSMAIFASHLDRSRTLAGEAVGITCLDTFVAVLAGFIVIPACFAFGVAPDAGKGLVFIALPNVFGRMSGGRIWGALFFLFLFCAALTTLVAVFENILSFAMDLWDWSRKKAVLLNTVLVILLSLPCIFGFSALSAFEPLGPGSNIMDLEDFIISNNILPLGSLVYLLFCTRKNGWGWSRFLREANAGKGLRLPGWSRVYLSYLLPLIIAAVYLKGYWDQFNGSLPFMLLSVALLGLVCFVSLYRAKPAQSPR